MRKEKDCGDQYWAEARGEQQAHGEREGGEGRDEALLCCCSGRGLHLERSLSSSAAVHPSAEHP